MTAFLVLGEPNSNGYASFTFLGILCVFGVLGLCLMTENKEDMDSPLYSVPGIREIDNS